MTRPAEHEVERLLRERYAPLLGDEEYRHLRLKCGLGVVIDGEMVVPSAPAEQWVIIDDVGGYVCAHPAPDRPDGICGMPTESEPCPNHTADTTQET